MAKTYVPNKSVLNAIASKGGSATFAELKADPSLVNADGKPFGGTATLTSLVNNGYLVKTEKEVEVVTVKTVSVYELTDKAREIAE